MVERFDRYWTDETSRRLLREPPEDCCQALGVPPTAKYGGDGGPGIPKIVHLLSGNDYLLWDRAIFLKALIVFWLLAAIDGHAKNLCLTLRLVAAFISRRSTTDRGDRPETSPPACRKGRA